jgi:hypothetical protein
MVSDPGACALSFPSFSRMVSVQAAQGTECVYRSCLSWGLERVLPHMLAARLGFRLGFRLEFGWM